jgi:hypothetical protein
MRALRSTIALAAAAFCPAGTFEHCVPLTVSIFGGTAESIALWFKSIGHETWFYYYLTALIAISLIVYVTMRDTKHHSAMGRHE